MFSHVVIMFLHRGSSTLRQMWRKFNTLYKKDQKKLAWFEVTHFLFYFEGFYLLCVVYWH